MNPPTAPIDSEQLSRQFQRDGFLVLPGYFSSERIDELGREIERVLKAQPYDVVVDNLAAAKYRSLWGDAVNREARHFKIYDLYMLSEAFREIPLEAALSELLGKLLGQPAVLCNSINFYKGSAQPRHIDSLYMTPQTPHNLIATWTALEDAHPDSGPLLYWPGSHLIPLYTFKDGTHHANAEEAPAWEAYMDAQLAQRGIEPTLFFAKKGDVFIWHSDLLHAGSPIKNANLTRNSLVCHYYTEADCRKQGCALVAQNSGYWMRRLPHPVFTPPEAFVGGRPFPEETYLARHADVKAAVEAGNCPSGWKHYETFGFKEGRGI